MSGSESLCFTREGYSLTAQAEHATLTITLEEDVAACALCFDDRETLYVAVQGLEGCGLAEKAVHVTTAVYNYFTSTPSAECVVTLELREIGVAGR